MAEVLDDGRQKLGEERVRGIDKLGRLEEDIGKHVGAGDEWAGAVFEITGIDENKKGASKNDVGTLGGIEFGEKFAFEGFGVRENGR